MDGPDSSYSCFEIHICWKVEREAKMDPPIQTEYLRSGGVNFKQNKYEKRIGLNFKQNKYEKTTIYFET
jgi:hypothetical protein